ncbi:MAG: glycosyltransferase family 4 protein [Candidatus Kapaibacterium sp.]
MNDVQNELENLHGTEGETPSPENRSKQILPKGAHRLLVIAYYFPPMGLSGVFRVSKFVKYLPETGWFPTVLTVGDVGYYVHDYALLQEVEEAGVEIVRTKTLDPLRVAGRKKKTIPMPPDRSRRLLTGISHTFLQPDNKIGWKRYAVREGLRILEEEKYDAILATAPPFTDFLIGLELSRATGVPLVVDYRDPWLDNKHYFYATPFHRHYAARMEQEVLKHSEGIVVVNRKIKEQLIARWPFLTHESVHIIPSGFDPMDLVTAQPERVKGKKMRFTYSGLFDARRTPRFFFEALGKVFAKIPESRDEIEMCFIGTFRDSYRKMATKFGVSSALVTPGYVEHREVMDWLLSSDVLWLTMYDPTITPGKVYEYMGTRKPILALAPEGIVRNVLDNYGAAVTVMPDKVEGIAEAIEQMYLAWKSNLLPVGDEEKSSSHDARILTGQLARLLAHSMRL